MALLSLNPQQPQEVSERPGGGGRGPGEHRELLPEAAGQVALGASWRPRGPARPVSVPHPSVAPRGSREKCQPPAHAARPLPRPPAEVSPPKLHTAPHGPAHSPRALRTGCTFCQFPPHAGLNHTHRSGPRLNRPRCNLAPVTWASAATPGSRPPARATRVPSAGGAPRGARGARASRSRMRLAAPGPGDTGPREPLAGLRMPQGWHQLGRPTFTAHAAALGPAWAVPGVPPGRGDARAMGPSVLEAGPPGRSGRSWPPGPGGRARGRPWTPAGSCRCPLLSILSGRTTARL